MKIAVQIFGHLRTYKYCYSNLYKYLLDNYDCDVFIHTWDTTDHDTKTWHDFKTTETGMTQEQISKELNDIYKPKAFKIETQVIQDNGIVVSNGREISLFGIKCMLHSMQQANKLRTEYQKQHNITYDLVIVLRPDIMLLTPFIPTEYMDKNDNNCLYTCGFYKKTNRLNDFRYIGASDLLFFAKPNVMDQIFDDISPIVNQIKEQDTTQYGPEYSFIYAIEHMGIKTILVNYLWNECFKILREPENHHTLYSYAKRPLLKQIINGIIRLHLRHNRFELFLLSALPVHIAEVELNFGKSFVFNFAIGKRK